MKNKKTEYYKCKHVEEEFINTVVFSKKWSNCSFT